jgi:cytidyltransferase-like protein
MIVGWDELTPLRGVVAMVDGGFDPLHPGHVDYFEAAAGLGAPLLCNVAADDWVSRKHPPLLGQAQRARIVDALRAVSYTHLSQTTTVDALRQLRPRYYVKGADWRGRLPAAEVDACALHDIEVVFLDTVVDSSSRLLEDYVRRLEAARA